MVPRPLLLLQQGPVEDEGTAPRIWRAACWGEGQEERAAEKKTGLLEEEEKREI